MVTISVFLFESHGRLRQAQFLLDLKIGPANHTLWGLLRVPIEMWFITDKRTGLRLTHPFHETLSPCNLWLFSSLEKNVLCRDHACRQNQKLGGSFLNLSLKWSKLCLVSQHCSQDDAVPSSTKLLSAQSREIHIWIMWNLSQPSLIRLAGWVWESESLWVKQWSSCCHGPMAVACHPDWQWAWDSFSLACQMHLLLLVTVTLTAFSSITDGWFY
jgi:hypothetical protein